MKTLTTLEQWFTDVHLSSQHLTSFRMPFPHRSRQMPLKQCRMRWFEIRSCKPTPEDLPPSSLQLFASEVRYIAVTPSCALQHTYVGAPHLMRTGDGNVAQEIWKFLVRDIWDRSSRPRMDRLNSHLSHQSLRPLAVYLDSIALTQGLRDLTAAVERHFSIDLINLILQIHILNPGRRRPVVHR